MSAEPARTPGPGPGPTPDRARARRELGIAVVACLLGGGLLLLSAGRSWTDVLVRQPAPLPAVRLAPTGGDIGGLPGALGLVGLAAVVALAATRRWGRLATGALVAAAGVVAAVVSVRIAVDLPAAVVNAAGVAGQLGPVVVVRAHPRPTVWPYLSAAGGLLLVFAGILTVARGRRWAVLSARYDAPAAQRHQRAKEPAVEQWDALDRGDDPTAPRHPA